MRHDPSDLVEDDDEVASLVTDMLREVGDMRHGH